MLGLATCVSSGVRSPIDEDLSTGTPDCLTTPWTKPVDEDPGPRPRNYRINPETEASKRKSAMRRIGGHDHGPIRDRCGEL